MALKAPPFIVEKAIDGHKLPIPRQGKGLELQGQRMDWNHGKAFNKKIHTITKRKLSALVCTSYALKYVVILTWSSIENMTR